MPTIESPTIASEEAYADWTASVHDELKMRGINIADAYDAYSFRTAYEDGMTPRDTVMDYAKWHFDRICGGQ